MTDPEQSCCQSSWILRRRLQQWTTPPHQFSISPVQSTTLSTPSPMSKTWHIWWPSNLSNLSKGQLAQGMFCTKLTKSFKEAQEKTGISIFALIPPIKGKGNKLEDSLLHNVELLLWETSNNFAKVDTKINVNTMMLMQTGLIICANIVLLCWAFTQVHSTLPTANDNHPTSFLFSAVIKLGDIITSRHLLDAILGNSKHTTLVLYTVLMCLNTIAACIGKEASNPDMLQ